MVTLLSNSRMGVCEWSIGNIEELDILDKKSMSPTSTATLVNSDGMRIFMLSSDKSEWVEL